MKFAQLETAQISSLEAAERVRRSHQRAIEEIREELRRLDAAPRCIGFCHLTMSADDSLTSGEAVDFDEEQINTTKGLVVHDGSYAVQLAAGYSYRLFAYLGGFNSSGFTLEYAWHNETDDEQISRRGFLLPADSTRDDAGQPAICASIRPAKTTRVYVKIAALSGTPAAAHDYSGATIEAYQ